MNTNDQPATPSADEEIERIRETNKSFAESDIHLPYVKELLAIVDRLRSQLRSASDRVLALEAHVGELREALELAAALPTHQLADPELLKVALAATDALAIEQPELPLIEEVRDYLEDAKTYANTFTLRQRADQLLAHLNPTK